MLPEKGVALVQLIKVFPSQPSRLGPSPPRHPHAYVDLDKPIPRLGRLRKCLGLPGWGGRGALST
jgi:hypothetical protein